MSDNKPLAYEIVNPSDPFTMIAPTEVSAHLAVAFLGEGKYSIKPIGDAPDRRMPFFMFGGSLEWFTKNFGDGPRELLNKHMVDVIAALRSVLIGDMEDREKIGKAVKDLSADEARKFIDHYHDAKRTSLNDIGGRAWSLASALQARVDQRRSVEPSVAD